MSTLVTSAGVVVHPWQPTRSDPFAVAFRVDYLLVRESATHFDSDDPSPVELRAMDLGGRHVRRLQLAPGVQQIAVMAGVGLEDVWSPTYVYVRGLRVATLPPLRAVAEAGFQLRF